MIVHRERITTPLLSESDRGEPCPTSKSVETPQNSSSSTESCENVVTEKNIITPDATIVDTEEVVSLVEQKDISM